MVTDWLQVKVTERLQKGDKAVTNSYKVVTKIQHFAQITKGLQFGNKKLQSSYNLA